MNEDEDVFQGRGILIELPNEDNFLKVKETLTRIGVCSKMSKTLYQTANILHKRGKYAIVHFKEMFILDGKESDIDDNDLARRNTIALLLEDWGLVNIVDESFDEDLTVSVSQIKIISHKDKSNWTLTPKYTMGNKKFIK